jgi:hypothetical protein
MAAKLLVMDFEILARSAILAAPRVSIENQESQLCIGFRTELDSRIFRKDLDHAEAF